MILVDLQVHVLGDPWVGSTAGPVRLSPSAAHTLAFLAIGPPEGRSRTEMAAQLFGECNERVARRRLSTAIWRLRSELRIALGIDALESPDPARVRIAADVAMTVDAVEFLRTAEPMIARPASSLDAESARALEEAVAMYCGGLLESAYDEWVLQARDRLSNVYLTALDYLIQYHGASGDAERVARFARRALELEPLREDFHRHVMSSYAELGRPDLVERQFETCRQGLLRELGADPMPETIALYGRLTRGKATDGRNLSIHDVVEDLEQARRDIAELSAIIDRALHTARRLH